MFLYNALDAYVQDQSEKDSISLTHHFQLRSSAKRNGTLPKSPTLSSHNISHSVKVEAENNTAHVVKVDAESPTTNGKVETDV